MKEQFAQELQVNKKKSLSYKIQKVTVFSFWLFLEIDSNWKTIRLFKSHDSSIRNLTETSSYSESSSQNAPEKRLNSDTETTVECGTIDPVVQSTPLVAQGQTIQRGTWPWLVAIYRHIGFAISFICGGSLISDRLIVTAAHCFTSPRILKVEDIALILGKYSLRKLDEEGKVIESSIRKFRICTLYYCSFSYFYLHAR